MKVSKQCVPHSFIIIEIITKCVSKTYDVEVTIKIFTTLRTSIIGLFNSNPILISLQPQYFPFFVSEYQNPCILIGGLDFYSQPQHKNYCLFTLGKLIFMIVSVTKKVVCTVIKKGSTYILLHCIYDRTLSCKILINS